MISVAIGCVVTSHHWENMHSKDKTFTCGVLEVTYKHGRYDQRIGMINVCKTPS